MALPLLSDLLTIPSQDDVLNQEVLPELAKRGAKVTAWPLGGVYRGMAYVVALMRVSVRTALAALAAAGFEQYVFGFLPAPGGLDVTGWAPLVALNHYGVTQNPATRTQRNITLTNVTSTAYGPLQPGSIILSFPSGNRYLLNQAVTIPANGSVQASFQGEFANNSAAGLNYNDAPDSTISLVTANYPGVTATNPAPVYSAVTPTGPSCIGTVTPSGTPGAAHNVVVQIVQSGTIAGATCGWQYALDAGAWSATQTGASAVVGDGITVTLADNGGNPSFVAGAAFYFGAPGTDITQQGADIETPQALGARCQALLPSLAFAKDQNGNWIPASPTDSAYAALAISANANVQIAFVVTDGTVNNKVLIYIAGAGGAPLSSEVIANVQQFFDAYQMLTDFPVVATPAARAITLAGMTVTCKAAQLASAQASMQAKLQAYLGGVDPQVALGINGRIDHAYLVELIRSPQGVVAITDEALTVNGTAGDLQLPVTAGAYEVATWGQQVATAFTWVTQ